MNSGPGNFDELLASARVIVAELLEEGIETFDARKTDAEPETESPEVAEKLDVQGARALVAPPAARPGTFPAEEPSPQWGPSPSLEDVRSELGDCRRCGLCEGRSQIVFGDGSPSAKLLFVGEGPGEEEDKQGLPFVGRAGALLTQMIEKGLGIPRQDVYICNVVKCRPPGNRDPLPVEVAACSAFLDGQIAAVKPKVIVSLGKPAASLLLGRNVAITRERGNWHSYRGIPLMLTLHPAYVLRRYTEENRRAVWGDLKAALGRALEGEGD